MRKKQVAVLDVGSSKITAIIGERGINKTFLIKGRFEYEYDGFADKVFFDAGRLAEVLRNAASDIRQVLGAKIEVLYVGVPGEFTEVVVKESQISFADKRKIRDYEVDALYDSAFVIQSPNHTIINRSAIVYELDDFRRLADPIGYSSEILKGKLSFVICDNYFMENVLNVLKTAGVERVECVSTALAEALYLIEPEVRDRISMILDVGYISTTFTIIQGDGLLFQKSFTYGGGFITAALTEYFDISFENAEKLKRKVNLSSFSSGGIQDVIDLDNGNYYSAEEAKTVILRSLDMLCENLSETLETSRLAVPEYVPIMLTGGGIAFLRGAKEHVANRLGMDVRILTPNVPLMNKPTESAVLSLMDLALEQQ